MADQPNPKTSLKTWTPQDVILLVSFMAIGALIAWVDNQLGLHTMLVESIHIFVVATILALCIWWRKKYPEILLFGWDKILWGVICLMIGSVVDILDDPPMLQFLQWGDDPFGRTWEQAFIKKIIGYSVGFGLVAYGFFQWIPWMIATRMNMENLNVSLSRINRKLKELLTSLDDRVEAERLNISRELHDDVAQQLAALNYQIQLCEKQLEQHPDKARETMAHVGEGLSEALRTIRQISRDLRPESLYSVGLVAALEQFIEKMGHQYPDYTLSVDYVPLVGPQKHPPLESYFNDRELLHIFRVLQESIRNALKHCQGSVIDLLIQEGEEGFDFLIEDDGKGLPWKTQPADDILVQQGHLGIVGMKERIAELGGTFTLDSLSGGGAQTRIRLKKPPSALATPEST